MVELRPADAEAYAELCDNLRAADARELQAAYAQPAAEVIAASIEKSIEPLAAWDDAGRLVAVFGHAPLGPILTTVASPWLLGTDLLRYNAGVLVKLSRQYVAAWREQHPLLVNFVDVRNVASIRYLKLVGFAFDEPAPFGPEGLPFHRFHLGFD